MVREKRNYQSHMCLPAATFEVWKKGMERREETERWNVVDKVASTGKIVRHSHGIRGTRGSGKVEIPPTLLAFSRHYKLFENQFSSRTTNRCCRVCRFNARFARTERGVPRRNKIVKAPYLRLRDSIEKRPTRRETGLRNWIFASTFWLLCFVSKLWR